MPKASPGVTSKQLIVKGPGCQETGPTDTRHHALSLARDRASAARGGGRSVYQADPQDDLLDVANGDDLLRTGPAHNDTIAIHVIASVSGSSGSGRPGQAV